MPKDKSTKEFGISWKKVWLPFVFLLLIWLVKWVEIKFDMSFSKYGLYPKNFKGLQGILAGPMIHGDLKHLINNSIPFTALSLAIVYFYDKVSNRVFLMSYIATGMLVWLFGRASFHIGASGIVYALASFVFFSGIIRRHVQLIAISLLVVFLYGGMIWGVFPTEARISWESHLSGAVVGFLIALTFRNMGPQRKKYDWEDEEETEVPLNPYWISGSDVTYTVLPKKEDNEQVEKI